MRTHIPTAEYATDVGRKSGSGQFSTVYVLPDGTAFKHSKIASADGWLWWALYCMTAEHDPLRVLPEVHGLRVDLSNNSYTASMEQLSEVLEPPMVPRSIRLEERKNVDIEMQVHRIRAFHSIGRSASDWNNDLGSLKNWHTHNWMQRSDGSFVASDPTAMRNWQDVKHSAENPDIPTEYGQLRDWLNAMYKLRDTHPELVDKIEVIGEIPERQQISESEDVSAVADYMKRHWGNIKKGAFNGGYFGHDVGGGVHRLHRGAVLMPEIGFDTCFRPPRLSRYNRDGRTGDDVQWHIQRHGGGGVRGRDVQPIPDPAAKAARIREAVLQFKNRVPVD